MMRALDPPAPGRTLDGDRPGGSPQFVDVDTWKGIGHLLGHGDLHGGSGGPDVHEIEKRDHDERQRRRDDDAEDQRDRKALEDRVEDDDGPPTTRAAAVRTIGRKRTAPAFSTASSRARRPRARG